MKTRSKRERPLPTTKGQSLRIVVTSSLELKSLRVTNKLSPSRRRSSLISGDAEGLDGAYLRSTWVSY